MLGTFTFFPKPPNKSLWFSQLKKQNSTDQTLKNNLFDILVNKRDIVILPPIVFRSAEWDRK